KGFLSYFKAVISKCKIEDIIQKVTAHEMLREESYTSRLIHITVPNPLSFQMMCLAFASDEVARVLICQTRLDGNMKVIHFIESSRIYSEAGAIRGTLFEHLAHERLRKGG